MKKMSMVLLSGLNGLICQTLLEVLDEYSVLIIM